MNIHWFDLIDGKVPKMLAVGQDIDCQNNETPTRTGRLISSIACRRVLAGMCSIADTETATLSEPSSKSRSSIPALCVLMPHWP
jgi:hypothetical protein